MFPTQMLETDTQRKILRVLCERNRRYTAEELSELCHRSESSISRSLQQHQRYPFIEVKKVKGSKQLSYRLSPESDYTDAIKEFFRTERKIERVNGTVPVEIWNLLEDITAEAERKEGFIEIFLFGSYVTGDYYSGSDIDLLLLHEEDTEPELREKIPETEKEIHLISNTADREKLGESNERIYALAPIGGKDTMIPLTGEIKL